MVTKRYDEEEMAAARTESWALGYSDALTKLERIEEHFAKTEFLAREHAILSWLLEKLQDERDQA